MGTWKQLLHVASFAVLASACGTSSSTSVNAPTARCAVTATAQPAAVGAPGGAGSIIVRTDRECAWEARSESDWLTISDSSGRGDGSMRYTAAGNPVVAERRGAVVVNGLRVEIGQAAAACAFNLDRSQQSVAATGGRVDVSVSAQAGCAWTARTDATWISITAGAAGQGPGTVSLAVSPNAAAEGRSSVVIIAGQAYLIEQAGAVAPGPGPGPAPPGDPNCALTVTPQTASVGAEGGAFEVRVSASLPTCAWTAVSGVPWIVMEGGVGETGSGTRRFVVAPNTTSASRVGNVGIAGVVVTVTQAAGSSPTPPAPPPPPPTPPPTPPAPPTPAPCTFTVAPTSAAFPAAGDAGEIAVTASAGDCAWTAASAAPWITIQGAAGGTGSGRIRINVAANADTSPRTGTLSVAGSTVSITQAAAAAPPPPTPPPPPPPPPACNYAISPNPVDVPFGGDERIDLQVVTSGGCAWTATSQATWITITGASSGSGDSQVRIAVAPTLAVGGRVGTLSIAGQTVTVNQSGILNQQVTISGTVSALSGSCPNRSFMLNGTTIVANRDTDFRDECSDLRDGVSARVRGIGQADGSILANRIDRIGDDALALPEEDE